jgi:hypothetical protein
MAMNGRYKLAAGCLIVLGLFGFNTFTNNTAAQESIDHSDRSNNIPLDDQVRFIGELESRSSDRWNFGMGEGTLTENNYQLQMPQSDTIFLQQNPLQWNHSGEGINYLILVTIYEDTSP